jgi:ABC-type antimicrobial peptide transport system permease subunit
MFAMLTSFFGALALLLTCVGLYGLLAHQVTARTREIGIRMALGASTQSVTRLIFSQGVRLTLLGLASGLFLSVVCARALSGLLFGVSTMDTGTHASVVALLGLVGAIAAWLPVRRAIAVDPVVLFRP